MSPEQCRDYVERKTHNALPVWFVTLLTFCYLHPLLQGGLCAQLALTMMDYIASVSEDLFMDIVSCLDLDIIEGKVIVCK